LTTVGRPKLAATVTIHVRSAMVSTRTKAIPALAVGHYATVRTMRDGRGDGGARAPTHQESGHQCRRNGTLTSEASSQATALRGLDSGRHGRIHRLNRFHDRLKRLHDRRRLACLSSVRLNDRVRA
jgi:hypothetical protein